MGKQFSASPWKSLRLETQHQLEVMFTSLHNGAVTIIIMSAENEEIMCFLQRLDKQLETICGGVRRLQLSAHQQIRKLEPL